MEAFFVWTRSNRESVTKHGISTPEAEDLVLSERPEKVGRGLYRVRGPTEAGQYVEVIYKYVDEESNVDWSEVDLVAMGEGVGILIFHARPLTENEKRRVRRRR